MRQPIPPSDTTKQRDGPTQRCRCDETGTMKEIELILNGDEAAAIEWRKAKSAQVGEASGRDTVTGAFWARTDGLEFLPFVEIVERSLEAHGWETNIENLLFSLESARLARRALIQSSGTASTLEKRALTFENVFAMDLPQRGRSGKLLKRLYALVSGAPNSSVTPPGSLEIDKHPAVQMMKQQMIDLETELEQLRRERVALVERAKTREQEKLLPLLKPAIHAEGGLEVRHLEVRSIDTERRVIGFKSSDRNFELGYALLPKFPNIGARALGALESRKLTGILPTGSDWTEISLVPGRVLAVNNSLIKFTLRGRREFRLQINDDSPAYLRRLRRSDDIVVKIAGDQALDICPSDEAFDRDANLRERLFRLRAEELGHQRYIRRQKLEESEITVSSSNDATRKAS